MGGRSAKAPDFLKSVGFKNVKNLKGGILDWIDKVDPPSPSIGPRDRLISANIDGLAGVTEYDYNGRI